VQYNHGRLISVERRPKKYSLQLATERRQRRCIPDRRRQSSKPSAILQINTKFNQSQAHNACCAHGSAPTGALPWAQRCVIVDSSPWVRRSALTGTQLNATRFWIQPFIGTLKPHSNGPLYSNTLLMGYIWYSEEAPTPSSLYQNVTAHLSTASVLHIIQCGTVFTCAR